MKLLWASVLGLTTATLTAGCGGSLNGSSGSATGGTGVIQSGAGGSGAGGARPGTGGGTGSAGFPGGSLDGGSGFGGGVGGTAGTTGDGGSGCTTTFSGAFSRTIGCNVTIIDPGWNSNQFSIGFLGGPLVGTPYTWSLNVIFPGKLRTGPFDLSSALYGTGDFVLVPGQDPPDLRAPHWIAWTRTDGGPMVGSITLTLTSVGEVTADSPYASPHGTATATMVDTVQGMPDLNQTVVF